MVSTILIRSTYNIKPAMRGGVVTIGNFDGVHKGHQRLLAQVVDRARALDAPAIVVTFEPHAFEFFGKDNVTIPRLTRMREKFHALAACGVDYVIILPFKQSLAAVRASNFISDVLVRYLAPREFILGDDFRFGYQREGDFALLQTLGNQFGFKVSAMETAIIEGQRVSSTWVRNALKEGNLELASQLLGHPYTMEGRIRRGAQRGREWGFPTANIYLHRKLTPVRGVFTVLVHGIADQPLPGVANVGVRPTVDGTRTLLEVHLLDFNQDLYGRFVRVEFCKKLRDEIRFSNLDLLREAIANDVAAARHYFQISGIS